MYYESLHSDPPVSDEGVLDVTVRVPGRRGPASLYTQHQVSRYLSHKHTAGRSGKQAVLFILSLPHCGVNNSCSGSLSQQSGGYLLTCGECWIAGGIIHSILPKACVTAWLQLRPNIGIFQNTLRHTVVSNCCCCCCGCDTISRLKGIGFFTMKTFTKMSSSSVSEGTVVHLSSKASSLYSNIDTEKFPSSVLRVTVLEMKQEIN